MDGFRKKLADRQIVSSSLVCVGLDPLPEKLPSCIKRRFWLSKKWEAIAQWMIDIVDNTAPYASMFKPQSAHYEAFGSDGRKILERVINYIREFHPDIPVFLDCKRGDIGRTQKRYRIAHFDVDGAEGMNFNPYMGKDCMSALVDKSHLERALVGLCYTSNPEAREVQDVELKDKRCYWEFIAERVLNWADEFGVVENAGLVMAAAYEFPKGSGGVYAEHLTKCRKIVGNALWFLIPGIGAQKGFVEQTVKKAYRGPGSIVINSSSEIDFASSGPDYADAAAKRAEELRDEINMALLDI